MERRVERELHPPDPRIARVVDLFEASPQQAVLFEGADHLLAFQNARSRTLAGIRPAGAPAGQAFPEMREYVLALDHAWRTGETAAYDGIPAWLARPDGGQSHLRVDAVVSRVDGDDGRPFGVLVQAASVSRRQEDEERLRVAQALSRVGLELSRSLDVDQVTAAVTRLAAEVFSGWGLLDLWQPDGSLRRMGATHHDPDQQWLIDRLKTHPRISGRPEGHGESWAHRSARTGEVHVATLDTVAIIASAASTDHAEVLSRLRPAHFITVPIGREPRRLGSLSVVRSDSEPPFDPTDRAVLEQFAERAALALAHASDYSEQRRAALTLQRSLLPAEPTLAVPGLQLAVRYRAGEAGTDVGGDWYDVVRVGPDTCSVVVGDVEGHDLEAAALMGQVRAVVHSHAAAGQPPAQVAAEANALVTDSGSERLVTMTFVQIHPQARLVSWLRAGHPPMVVVEPSGASRLLLGRGGLPLGVERSPRWQEETVLLPAGSLVALCTDGLVESRNRPAEQGLAELAVVLRERHGDDLELIADAVLDELTREHPQRDDIALVLLRLSGADDRDGHTVVRTLPPRSASAPIARRFAGDVLTAWGLSDELTQTAELLITELVSNASRNSDSPLELRVSRTTDGVRIGVVDDSHRLPHTGTAGLDDTSGRGLQLVEMLSSSWGVDLQERGKIVWFELAGP